MNSSNELVLNTGPQSMRVLPFAAAEKELSLKDVWGVFKRRKFIVLATLALCVCLAILLCIFSTRRYQAVGELQVQKEGMDALGLESMMGEGGGSSDALDSNVTIQTQAQVLQSDSLALKVIKDLHLEKNDDFQPKFSVIGWVFGLMSPSGPSDPKVGTLDDSPGLRTHLLGVFSHNLKVKPVAGTRLIDVKYLNPDPKVAAAVVNHLIDGLADYNFQTRYNATSQAANWLSGQLSDLRKQSEDLQAKVVSLQRQSGVFTLGETDTSGREQVYTPVLDRLEQATAQLSQAQSNRILKGALYQVVKSGDPELISGLAGTSMAASSGAAASSLSLIQNLRGQQAVLQGQLDETSAKFGPSYPKLSELRANLDAVNSSIAAEVARVGARAKNDYNMSQQVETDARAVFAHEKTQADALNDKAIEYMIVRQEADQSRSLYENLLNKLKEAGVLAGLRSSNISVVDMARVPFRPAKPNVLLYIAGAIVGGLFLGSCGAFLRDTMDNKIQNLPDLEAYLGEMPLGVLPFHKEPRSLPEPSRVAIGSSNVGSTERLAALYQPRSPYTEALRALRTSLMLSREGSPPQVILITSSVSGEGKSMLSVNLAALLTQQNQGKRVLLVDGDMRRPVLHRRLNVPGDRGLSSILASNSIETNALSTAMPLESIPGLDLLPAGPVPPYPAELIGSEQMRKAIHLWRDNYDFIIIDGAPVLPVTDSVLLSTMADLSLVVVRFKMTERQSLERSCRLLQTQGNRQRIGVVLNAVERSSDSYFQYFGYRYSNYHGTEQHA